MSKINVTTSQVFDAIRRVKSRVVVLEGSSRSTKTYSLLQFFIAEALENEAKKKPKNIKILIVRSKLTWIKATVLEDFKDILKEQFQIWNEKNFNKSSSIYTMGHTQFVFRGADSDQKLHGVKAQYVFFNEINELPYPVIRQILIRLKGRMFCDYNPNIPKNHYINTKIKTRKDCSVIHSTFLDNPFLEQSIVEEIKSLEPTLENIENGTADETSWKIYGLGIMAQMSGLVFPVFDIIPKMPIDLEESVYGMDFGFTNDPSVLINIGAKDTCLYLDEKMYERGLTNIENLKNPKQISIEQRFGELDIPTRTKIYADSAEPKSIADLKGCGYNVIGAKKGRGSILDGIQTIKRFKIYITESSLNLITEFQRYKWIEDKNGEETNKPIDNWNHGIDALRYGIQGLTITDKAPHVGHYSSIRMSNNVNKYSGF